MVILIAPISLMRILLLEARAKMSPVARISLNANKAVVFHAPGSAMVIEIVMMAPTRILPFARILLAIRTILLAV